MNILTYDVESWPFFNMVSKNLMPVDTLLDVGAGIRPQRLIQCTKHICAEPHFEYADILEANGFEVIRKKAIEALDEIDTVETIIAMDVIEHMDKEEGLEFFKKAMTKFTKQLVIFTPTGFMEQTGGDANDPWGLQGQFWQKHRSGWTPKEFPGASIYLDEYLHEGHEGGAFFAVYTK